MKGLRSLLAVSAVLGSAVAFGAPARVRTGQPSIDPRADALLHRMSADLSNLRTFQVQTNYSTEVVTRQGEKIQMLGESNLSVKRPNMLRTDRSGPRGDVTFFYDGRNVTVYGARANLYATANAPPTLDRTIDFTRQQLDLEAPAADLLYSNPYQALMEDVISGRYIGEEPIGNRMCHHLAYRGHATDWEIWIDSGPRALPCRFEITTNDVKGRPEFAIAFHNWRLDPPLSNQMFAFRPPPGAARISFLTVAQRRQRMQQRRQQRMNQQQQGGAG